MDNFSKSKNQIDIIKKIVSLILAVFFLYFMMLFLKPTAKNIFNLGNTLGVFVSAFLALCCIYYDRFFAIIKKIWGKKIGRIFLIGASVIISILAVYCIVISVFMVKSQRNSPPSPKPMIVLGAKINGENPSEMLTRRLEAAAQYLEKNPDAICVVSGGKGEDEQIPEAHAMRKFLVSKGIDDSRILVEDKSINTSQNIEFSKKMLEEKFDTSEVIIVTDGFHQFRASVLAKQNGMKAYAINAKTNPDYIPTFWVREWVGILKDAFVSAF